MNRTNYPEQGTAPKGFASGGMRCGNFKSVAATPLPASLELCEGGRGVCINRSVSSHRTTVGRPARRLACGGFSLIELTLAIGMAAFCLIAVFGLMPVGIQTNRNAAAQMAASGLVAEVVSDLRATPKGTETSSQFAITFGTDKTLYFDSAGQAATSLGAGSRYRVKVTWSGSVELRFADLKVSWPAPVDPVTTTAGGSVEIVVAFDRM